MYPTIRFIIAISVSIFLLILFDSVICPRNSYPHARVYGTGRWDLDPTTAVAYYSRVSSRTGQRVFLNSRGEPIPKYHPNIELQPMTPEVTPQSSHDSDYVYDTPPTH
ncbi:hypothetical protein Ddc_13658 [Ditylenchus destructor]|nr:hypothetical protein Ddc_13658 [Ditylenchus destructor]